MQNERAEDCSRRHGRRFHALLRQPFRCRGDQSGGLFELLKALRVLPDHDLLDKSLNNPHDRLRQRCATTPAGPSLNTINPATQRNEIQPPGTAFSGWKTR
jgi:hypothetical protein